MSNEQEIVAIEKTLARAGLLSEHYNKSVAKVLTEAGYRKADEVRKEIFKELFSAVEYEPLYDNDEGGYIRLKGIKELAKECGVEVDE